MRSRADIINDKAVEILAGEVAGLRYSELIRRVSGDLPSENFNTIRGAIWDLDVRRPTDIFKPARGVFQHVSFRSAIAAATTVATLPSSIKEEDFYAPFAHWIKDELEECTKAISLGGSAFGGKWGTPDVIGVRESHRTDIIKAPTEVVSAEIKIDTRGIIEAFGQACSYKLFSHRVYIVIPNQTSDADKSRIDSLCTILGIGLILFDATNPSDPKFQIQVRAIKHDPDMFYVNENMKHSAVKALF